MPSPPSPHGIYETGSIDKERQARPSCSTSESKHFLASRDLYSTLHALREKRRSSRFEKHRSYCDSIALPRENFKTKRVGHVEIRTRSRRKKENEKKFSTLHVACTRTFVTWDPNMARIKGTGQGFSTLRKKLRVLSFDSVGACFQRCFFRDD